MENINAMMLEVLNERVKELENDIKSLTLMELNATNKREQFRYGMLCAQSKDLLGMTKEAIKHIEDKMDSHKSLMKDIEKMIGKHDDEICFEDVQDLFVRMLQGL